MRVEGTVYSSLYSWRRPCTYRPPRFDLICSELQRVEWTDDVSHAYGRIKAGLERRGSRIEDFDVAIAAHALALGATLVTSNVEHMARVPGIRVEDWGQ